MLRYKTDQFAGAAVQYSPFLDNRILVGASANFGLVGNGRLYVLDIDPQGVLRPFRLFDTQDAVFGAAWNELNENQAVVANGDGALRLFDTSTAQPLPVMAYKEHAKEAFGVNWNLVNKNQFASCSWDGLIKVWDPLSPASIATLGQPNNVAVYQAKFSPRNGASILSAHGDGTARITDSRTGIVQIQSRAVLNGDCMCIDWNKYDDTTFATGGVDKVVKVWDTRNLQAPINDFHGHQYAVKSVKWSAHSATQLMSTSYDMSVKVWDMNASRVPLGGGARGLIRDFTAHTEFAIDCDWSLWGEPGWVASVAWDQMLYIWKAT